jgi:hypothetical protein
MIDYDRQQIIKGLHAAAPFLDGRHAYYVCIAVSEAMTRGVISSEEERRTIDYVMSKIRPYSTVASWLMSNSPKKISFEVREALATSGHYGLLTEYRQRWINHMIEELSVDLPDEVK